MPFFAQSYAQSYHLIKWNCTPHGVKKLHRGPVLTLTARRGRGAFIMYMENQFQIATGENFDQIMHHKFNTLNFLSRTHKHYIYNCLNKQLSQQC